MDESASSSVSSGRTITGIRQGAPGTRPTSARDGEEQVGSWNGFENHGRDAGDIINNVENVEGRGVTAVTIKTTPPPAYATLSPHPSGSGSGTTGEEYTSAYPYVPHTHPEFGPTPLTAQHPLLAVPYHAYEYIGSPGAPDRRARWRFAGGLFWAVVVLTLMGALGALGLVGEFGGDGGWGAGQ